MIIEEMTMTAFQEGLARTTSVVIPFGSVEEHGTHLPLGTDTLHAYELAKEASQNHPFFVAPPVWYGLCRSTSEHPGTVTISSATLKGLVRDLLLSYYRQGLRTFVLLTGHAGGTHLASLVDAGEEMLSRLEGARIAALTVLDLVAQIPDGLVETPGDAHAGEVETALMQHLRPGHVHGTSPEEYPTFPKFILVRNKRRYWPGGVWGDPSKASPKKGRDILHEEAKLLAQLVQNLESFNE